MIITATLAPRRLQRPSAFLMCVCSVYEQTFPRAAFPPPFSRYPPESVGSPSAVCSGHPGEEMFYECPLRRRMPASQTGEQGNLEWLHRPGRPKPREKIAGDGSRREIMDEERSGGTWTTAGCREPWSGRGLFDGARTLEHSQEPSALSPLCHPALRRLLRRRPVCSAHLGRHPRP